MNDDENVYLGVALVIIVICFIGAAAAIGPIISDWVLK